MGVLMGVIIGALRRSPRPDTTNAGRGCLHAIGVIDAGEQTRVPEIASARSSHWQADCWPSGVASHIPEATRMCLSSSTASGRKNNDYQQPSSLLGPVETVCWLGLWPSRKRTRGGKKAPSTSHEWKGRRRILKPMTAKTADDGSQDLPIELWVSHRRCADGLREYCHNRVM